MKTSEPKPEEILKKYTFGDPAKLWADDAEKAMQEYAESYHKEKLREFVCSRCVNITNEMINFLKTGK